jgi:heme exporter protein A
MVARPEAPRAAGRAYICGSTVYNWPDDMRTLPRTDVSRPTTAAVRLDSVTRLFGSAPALIRVDLTVEPGETIVLRGPNGAGKTTLLRVIATSLSPTYGGGSVLGFDLARERDQVRRRVELLTHRTRLYDELTALENLRLFATLLDLDPRGAPEALERVGMGGVAGERVRAFSHGMRQRVAVARTLLRSPELLLLDEPYTGLDADARRSVDDLVVAAHTDGRTVVLATHHQLPEALVHREVGMDGGRILG